MIEEDLPQLVRDAIAVSAQHCIDCRHYHVMWPLLRLAGRFHGVDADRTMLERIIGAEIAAGRRRILMAGCADTGVMAMVMRAAGGQPVAVHAVDRCGTPLALSGDFAAGHGLTIATETVDLADFDRPAAADLVIVHSTLSHVPESRFATTSVRLADALGADGRIIMTSPVGTRPLGGERSAARLEARIALAAAALERHGIALPDLRELAAADFHKPRVQHFASTDAIGAWAGRHGLAVDRIHERPARESKTQGVIAVLRR